MRLPRWVPGTWVRLLYSFLVVTKAFSLRSLPGLNRGQIGAEARAGHWRVPTLYSQRDLHSIRGDWGGGVWDSSEVTSREWRRLKYIIVHGTHFFLE